MWSECFCFLYGDISSNHYKRKSFAGVILIRRFEIYDYAQAIIFLSPFAHGIDLRADRIFIAGKCIFIKFFDGLHFFISFVVPLNSMKQSVVTFPIDFS